MRPIIVRMIFAGGMQRICSYQAGERQVSLEPSRISACAGAPLWQILEAGEWRSPAFLKYLDLQRLETDLVVQAHVDESESEDEEAAGATLRTCSVADSSA
jgi:hypothetical protein